ncbi:MAG: hypothetical protein WKF77_10075 [Planctomycetaceae bacterium]
MEKQTNSKVWGQMRDFRETHYRHIKPGTIVFIQGVALAPDQNLGNNGTTYSIDTHGNLIVHGANAGLQFTY